LVWDKSKGVFVKSTEYAYNGQSTYLYDIINGFSLCSDNEIVWVDSHIDAAKPIARPRKNVFLSTSDYVYDKIEGRRCERMWSFTREEQV